jgi:chitinase
MAKFVDVILMMTFDFTGPWNGKIGFHSALYGNGEDTIDSRVKYFEEQGVPSEKLILGIPFFGRSFVTRESAKIGDSTENDFGFPGPFVKENGFLGYNEICKMRKDREWEVSYDTKAAESIGKFSSNGLNHVVTFPSPRAVANKVKYAVENNLGGVWAWFVDTDDYLGQCKNDLTTFSDFPIQSQPPRREKSFPLLKTINEAIEILNPNDEIFETDWRFG